MIKCSSCNESSNVFRMMKCVICFAAICENCAIRRYAKVFCGTKCISVFFFGTGEEDEG